MDDGKLLTLLDVICNAISNVAGSMPSGAPFAMQQVNRAKAMMAEQYAVMEAEAKAAETPAPEPKPEPTPDQATQAPDPDPVVAGPDPVPPPTPEPPAAA